MDLLNFPEHILIKICEYSTTDDLQELMTSCQYFNDLVSNSKKLMAKFCLHWRPDQKRGVIQKSMRKYQKVTMNLFGAYRKSTVALFEKFAMSLEEFEINYNYIKSKDIQLMLTHLSSTNKIKVGKFKQVYYKPSSEFNDEDIVKIESLKELHLDNSDCRIMQHFQGIQLNKFKFEISRACEMHDKAITNFLETQLNLKHLVLNPGAIPSIFKTDVSDIFKFKLQELEISLKNLTEKEAGNINKFLKAQSGSLKYFKVFVDESNLQVIASMLNHINLPIVHLEFKSLIFTDDFLIGSLCNVTHLVLCTGDVPKEENVLALNVFKNITELTLKDIEFNQVLLAALKNLPKLKKITLMDVKMNAFGTIPQVTELVLHNEKFKNITNFLKINKQVVKVKISGQVFVHAGYLMIILKKYKNVKHIDFSEICEDWSMDRVCLDTIADLGGDLSSLVLPKYMKMQIIVRNVSKALNNLSFA